MDYQKIINDIMCKLVELQNSVVKKISILHNGTIITTDVISMNFTGSDIDLSGLNGAVTIDIPPIVNLISGTNISITGTYPNLTINSTGGGGGPTIDAWNILGNTGTNPVTNFLGTIDNIDLRFRRFNLPIMGFGPSYIAMGLNPIYDNTNVNSIYIGNDTGTVGTSNTIALGSFAANALIGGSNFVVAIGSSSGRASNLITNSVLIGQEASRGTSSIQNVTAIGYRALFGGVTSDSSTFIGNLSGQAIINVNFSAGIGPESFYGAEQTIHTLAAGFQCMKETLTVTRVTAMGYQSGINSSIITDSVFIGNNVANTASSITRGTYLGHRVGVNTFSITDGVGLGTEALSGTNDSATVIAIGNQSLSSAIEVTNTIAIGALSALSLLDSSEIIAIGGDTLTTSSGLSHMIVIGKNAGTTLVDINHCILIGRNVGTAVGVSQIGSFNTIIGTNITLPTAVTSSLNIGGIIFGTGMYSTTAGSPSAAATATGRVGIGVVTPTANLHVKPHSATTAAVRIEAGGAAPSTLNNGDIWFDGTNIFIRVAGVTKTFTIV